MVKHLGTLETRDDNGNLKRVEVIATERPQRKESDFVKFYDEGLRALASNPNLPPMAIRLYLHLVATAGFENWIDFNQTDLAKQLGMARPKLNKALRTLINEGFIIKDAPREGWRHVYRINPHVAYRGKTSTRAKAINRTRAIKPKLELVTTER